MPLYPKKIENSHFIFGCMLLAFLFLGATYSTILGETIRYWDEEHYLLLAHHLHKGIYAFDGNTPTAFQPPGYPFFLFLISTAIPLWPALRFFNFLLLGGSITMAYLLMQRYFSDKAALALSGIAMLYPLFIYTAGTFFPQTMETTLLVGIIFMLAYPLKKSLKYDLVAGIFLGMLILTVPLFMLYTPFICLFPLFFKRHSPLKSITLLMIGCLIMLLPWIARNQITMGNFIPIATNGGINLLIGNSENTRPDAGVNADLSAYQSNDREMDEAERDQFYRDQALAWISANPLKALKLYFLKVANYFNFKNELASKDEGSQIKNFLSFITYYPLLLLAIVRLALFRTWPLNPLEKFLFLLLVITPFFQALFFTRLRFRLPFDFLMLFLALPGLLKIIERNIGLIHAGIFKIKS